MAVRTPKQIADQIIGDGQKRYGIIVNKAKGDPAIAAALDDQYGTGPFAAPTPKDPAPAKPDDNKYSPSSLALLTGAPEAVRADQFEYRTGKQATDMPAVVDGAIVRAG